MFLGLRTVIYKVADLERTKTWYSKALGIAPYFDKPYYVGEGIRVASVTDPFGNLFGIIENPNFRLPGQK